MTSEQAIHYLTSTGMTPEQVMEIVEALKDRPTGEWIVTDDDMVYCSECEDSYYPRPIDASWHYCPHCGAIME